MIKILKIGKSIDKRAVKIAVKHLKKDNLIIYPTDTSYGLGALLGSKEGVKKIYTLKKRQPLKKLSAVAPSFNWLKRNLEIDRRQEEMLREYLPGMFTFILKYKGRQENLAVRIPDANFIRYLSAEVKEPITATSANISGESDCYSVKDLEENLFNSSYVFGLDILVFDGGELKKGSKSTVVDLTCKPFKVIRQGSGEIDDKKLGG